jgi:hypothetical protein
MQQYVYVIMQSSSHDEPAPVGYAEDHATAEAWITNHGDWYYTYSITKVPRAKVFA